MSKKSLFGKSKRVMAFMLSLAMVAAAVFGTDVSSIKVYAADAVNFVGEDNGASGDQTIKGDQNLGTLNTSASVTYWFAGNGFYGMNRTTKEFGEDYDSSDWYLVDTDAMWGGNYLYSQWGNAYRSSGSDLYATSDDDDNVYYYQKILSYGESLWENYSDEWFTGQEADLVDTATVTTTNGEYRTYEDYVKGTTTSGSTYNYWIGAADASDVGDGTYAIKEVKKWYETSSTDTTKYLTLTEEQDATTYENSAAFYYDTYNFSGISDGTLGVKSSNIYSVIGAHLYSPSYTEYSANSTVYKKIINNIKADYLTKVKNTSYPSAAASQTSEPITAHFYDRSRTNLWSRSFSGLRVYDSGFGAWSVDTDGYLDSYGDVTVSRAVAPAFNLDVSDVVMARSATAAVSPDSSLASYNPNGLGSNVTFTLESDALSLTTDIANKQLNNVVGGQTYTVSYSNASLTGEEINDSASSNYYISAAIYDSNDEMVYYGQLAEVTGTSGTVTITIPNTLLVGEEYKLALFEEQINGAYTVTTPAGNNITTYTTDYVSPMNVATFTLESISATANADAELTEESTYDASDIADLITVTSVSQGTLTYGTDYTILSVDGATLDGTTITTGDNSSKSSKTITVEVGYTNSDMAVVPSATVELTVASNAAVDDNTYQSDQASTADEDGFYSYTDLDTGITWKYKTNDAGYIVYLYTTDDPSALIDSAGTLNIPKTVAGLTVQGIGGGTESTPAVPVGVGNWTSLSFPDSLTTINDYAFAGATQQASVVIPKSIIKIGAKAFYKSSITSLKINEMTGEVGYLAFGSCSNLSSVTIKGIAATLAAESFANSGITNLDISGTVFIKENAFENVTGITSLYLPNGVDADAYAFNGCTGITTLESDMSVLYNDAFIGCTSIKRLILDDNVIRVEYDWNGHTATTDRTIYIKNSADTYFQYYGNTGSSTYYSSYGTSGAITVVYDDKTGTDAGGLDDNVLTALTQTLASPNSYKVYYYGQSSSVTFTYVGATMTVEEYMTYNGISDVYIVSDTQTGISASCSSSLMADQSLNKDNVTVTALYGSSEGIVYDTDHFYIIRYSDFNTLVQKGSVTEINVADYEPLTAIEDDIASGLTAAVVVFSSLSNEGSYTSLDGDYYYQTLSIRVEAYDDEEYLLDEYGSYAAILAEINNLTADIADMEDSMRGIITSINSVLGTSYDTAASDLTSEYESAVNALIDALTDANDALSTANSDNATNLATVQSLISAINSIYGTSITLSDSATTSEISEAISEALQAIQDDQSEKDATILMLTENYVDIAQMLADYLSDTDNLEADAVDGTTIADIKTAIASALADLEEAKEKLTAIDSALNSLYSTLNDALASMGLDITLDYSEDSSAAEKIAAISTVIEQIAEAYNDLLSEYNSLSSDYQTIISYVYGDDATGDVSADDIVAQIESNQQEAIEEAVEEALSDAEYLSSVSETVQDSIAETINAIMDGEDVSTDGLSSDLVDALSTVQEMQANVTSMQASIDGYTSVLSAIRNALDLDDTATTSEVLSAISSLKDQVSTLTDQVSTLTSENATLTTENASLTARVAELEEQVATLTSENAALTAELEDMTAANVALSDKITTLTSENEALEEQVATLTSENADLEKQVTTLTAQVEALSDGSDTAETISNLSAQVATLTSENADLEEEVASLTSENESLTNENETLEEQVSSLTSENESLEEQVATLTSENADLEKQVTTLTAQVEALSDGSDTAETISNLTAQVVSLTSENEDLEEQVKTLTAQVEALSSSSSGSGSGTSSDDSETISSLEAQVASLTSENESLEEQVKTLTAQVEALSSSSSGSGSGTSSDDSETISSLEAQVASLTSENEDLEKQVSSLNTQVSSLNSANSTLTSQIDTLTSANTTLTSKVSSLNSQISSLTSQIASLSSSSDTSSAVSTLSSQVSSLTSDNDALTAEVASLTSANSSLALQVSSLTEQVSSLTEQVASLTSENESLTSENEDLEEELASLQKASNTASITTKSTTAASTSGTATVTTKSTTASVATEETETTDDSTTTSSEVLSDGDDNDEESDTASFHSISGTTYEQGTAVAITAPTTDEAYEVSSSQEAATEIIQLTTDNDDDDIDLVTNTDSYVSSSSYQRSIATLIITYYANHLDELGDLGSEEIKEAATDSDKTVALEMLYSVDVEATEEQLADMEENGSAELTLTSDNFEDGETYLVVHESEQREEAYDVLLVTADGNDLTFSLPDFSPITVAKVSINGLTGDEAVASPEAADDTVEEAETEESIEAISDVAEENVQSGSSVGTIVVCIIIVIIFIALIGGLLFMMKRQQDK